jgi:hypothetical protein
VCIIASALAAAKKTIPRSINGTLFVCVRRSVGTFEMLVLRHGEVVARFGLVLSCERQVEVRVATDSGIDEKN